MGLAAATCRMHTGLDKLRCCMARVAYLLAVFGVDMLMHRRCCSLPAGSAVLPKVFAIWWLVSIRINAATPRQPL